MKFFLFTQISGLLMLFAILTLVYLHYDASGVITFAYADLLDAELDPSYAFLLMLASSWPSSSSCPACHSILGCRMPIPRRRRLAA